MATSFFAVAATVLSLVALIPQLLRVRKTTEGVSRSSYVLWFLSMVWWGLFSVAIGAWAGAASCVVQLVLLAAILRYLVPERTEVLLAAASVTVGGVLVATDHGSWALIGAATTTIATGWPQLRLAIGHPHHLAGVAASTWFQYGVGLLCWTVYEWRIHQLLAMGINLVAAVPALLIAIRVHRAHQATIPR